MASTANDEAGTETGDGTGGEVKRPSEVSCSGQDSYTYKPPMQETCRPAQTLTSYLNRVDMAQQGTPLVDQRGMFPKTRRCAKPETVPPWTRRTSSMNTPTPVARHPLPKVTMKTPLDDSGDYALLSPVINDNDAPTTTGTDNSGFAELEQWRQHMHHPPSLEGTCKAMQFIWQL